ncbi:amidase [Hirsutella rhossiliensis]|uniref:Amidase domain-containing protein n=1 Tax=Hirsutella rhossiliensis TaxID=111463 RepID=A0A9P8ML31_9HYPO|nr:amidase domain-containing protein [Hirsutella rhossiliensis]KAH0957100.1 amidase domain-containing protein [Hirsutella rhossiliensis]
MKSLVTCLVAGSQYLLHPEKLGTVQETIKPDAIIPVTVLDTREIFGNVDDTLRRFDRRDDVFVPDFGFVLIEKPSSNSSSSTSSASHDRRGHHYRLMDGGMGPKKDDRGFMANDLARLPSGPYFLHGPNLYQAWRLYDDEAGAFAFGVIPENVTELTASIIIISSSSSSAFRTLPSLSNSGSHRAIAVPSRLYHPAPTRDKPLSGMRVSIPDSVSLQGVPTTLSSRAWHALHASSPADATAPLARRLLDLGAVVVGQTKSSQLAAGREWVDEQAPWNPRGDGYQRPAGGGAAGAAAAVAAYTWLRAAYGLDGVGGVEGPPAASHGLFTLRTTPGAVSLNGTQSGSPSYDSIALVGRDMPGLLNTASAVFDQSPPGSDPPLPGRLVYPVDTFDGEASEDQQKLTAQFLRTLEVLNGIRADKVNMTATWTSNPPPEAQKQTLSEYLKGAAFGSFCYEFYHAYDEFRAAYQAKFQHAPYMEATAKYQWQVGKAVSRNDYEAYQHRIGVFRKWFNDRIAPSNHSRTEDFWTAVILPVNSQAPRYRDDVPSAPAAPSSLAPELLPLMLRAPQLSVPFAQLPYDSRISERTEYRAVAGSIMGPPGSDMLAVHLVHRALDNAGWYTTVAAGRLPFPEGYNPGDDIEKPPRVPGDPDEL